MVQYRRDIDGLRALAVVPVVLGHAGIPGFSGGFIGVDIFFVISGFLITGILLREAEAGQVSIYRFYERRARRILPALFVVLTVVAGVGALLFLPDQYSTFAKSAIATVAFASNFWFLRSIGDYFGTDAEFEPLLHTWSLAVEEQFYIVFPMLVIALAGRSAGASHRRLMIWIILMSVASFLLSVWATSHRPLMNFFLTPMRAWELGVGALLAMGILPNRIGKGLAEIVAGVAFGAILAAIVFYDRRRHFRELQP